ncbi:hypothetical protein CDD82_6869 [Ophiocordyceps australis]|uniref:FAR1 domain-containing protein n=1 Tax=Ophiocordyceps australis TaxID=1399860 RepID=A0A2C5XYE7_9HYPO|nr:hypothetical protein CDD82_6869 [Ophiocordyceps australis]
MEAVLAKEYASFEAARDAIYAAAKEQGVALAIHSRWPNKDNATRVTLRCSKGRKYRDQRLKDERSTTTQMTECGYRIIVKSELQLTATDPTCRVWYAIESGTKTHNHEFTPSHTHLLYRRENLEAHRENIVNLYNSGIRPFEIAAQLGANDGNGEGNAGITKMQVYNALAHHRQREPSGHAPPPDPEIDAGSSSKMSTEP